ncbi:MAG: FapA family protein [Spirochaetales bacterium]
MRGKEKTIAQLLKESQDMIQASLKWGGPEQGPDTAGEAPGSSLAELNEAAEPVLDAYCEVFLEEDQMSAVAEFRPPGAGGKPLVPEDLERLLLQKNITSGVLWPVILEAMQSCNLEHKLLTNVVIAQGEAPQPFVPEHLELEEHWQKPPEVDQSVVAIDWKEFSPFVMVKKGDLLAHRVPEVQGKDGTTVLGAVLAGGTSQPAPLRAGETVVETPIGLEAAEDGRLEFEKGVVSVSPVLDLDQGVSYKTGNIKFHGDVIIHKSVADGFVIEAGGALSLDCVLDAWKVKTGNDLVTNSGIVGKEGTVVEVGGKVNAKYLNRVSLSAQGDVLIENSILNSLVKTRGKLKLGDKGIVAGGCLQTLRGIDTFHISTPTGPRTELICGIDFQGMEQITALRESSRDFANQLHKVEAAIPHANRESQVKLRGLADRLREEILALMERSRDQLMALGQDEEASVVVRGNVWPDTLVEICHVRFLVTQKMTAVKFVLDKRKGVISVVSLKKT